MGKLLHQSWLFLAAVFGIIFGVIIGIVFRVSFFSSVLWLVFSGILFLFSYFKPTRFMLLVSVFAGIIIGMFRVSSELEGQNFIKRFQGEMIEISGIVRNDPDTDEGGTKYKLTNLEIFGRKTKGTIFVSGAKNLGIERGDKVILEGKISEGFGVYSGAMYRAKEVGIYKPEPGDIFLNFRKWFSGKVREKMPEKEANLGLAYLLGMKGGLGKDMMEILRVVGLTHIVVASGTHLGIIVGFAKKFFGKISRAAGLILSFVLIFSFGSMVGWTASITRAAIMAMLSLIAWYVGRQFQPARIILITIMITLMIDPMFLVDVGWLLSFGAFSGILIIGPEIQKFLHGDKKPNFIESVLLATISATVMCLPISLYYFGAVSLISLIANVLILPTVAVAMGMTFLSGIVSFVPILSDIVVKITTIILDYHLIVMEFFGAQKMFLIEIKAGNPIVFLLYIPIIIFLVFIEVRRRRGLCCSYEQHYAQYIQ